MKKLARRELFHLSPNFITKYNIVTRPMQTIKANSLFGTNMFRKSQCIAKSNSLLNVLGSSRIGYYFSDTEWANKYKYSKPKTPVQDFLVAQNIEYIIAVSTYKIKYCPFCIKPHNEERSNLYVCNVDKQYGFFHCFRCTTSGSWGKFREKIIGSDTEFSQSHFSSQGESNSNQNNEVFLQTEYFVNRENLLTDQKYKDVLNYVKSRGFNEKTISDYNLGAGTKQFTDEYGDYIDVKCVYFPMYRLKNKKKKVSIDQEVLNTSNQMNKNFKYNNTNTDLVKVKVRGASKEDKVYMMQYPVNSPKGLFGFNLIKDQDKTVVITEGQFDAMAVYQQANMPAVSLPQGASNLPDDLLPYFERFDKIILWMDNDIAGAINVEKIAYKLGEKRTVVVKHSIKDIKDANDLLMKGMGNMINELINKSQTIPDENIVEFKNFRDKIKQRLRDYQKSLGVKISWFPYFNQHVKGVRPGQLTVVSGPTGSGKTTFLSQLFLDYCQKNHGLNILWGSFQVRNEILMTTMLNQFSKLNLAKQTHKFDMYADRFEQLNIHFMNFYGSTKIDKIISTITYAIEKHLISAIVLDTLQFMLSEQAEGNKRFELQDRLMAQLREISVKYNVHIAIVIHPRKTEENQDIGIHSIYGTSKSTQEADNIWIIQNRQGYKVLDIKKNRYDGSLGSIPLGFDRESKRYFQLTKSEFENVRAKEKTMKQIIDERKEEQKINRPISEEERMLFDDQIQPQNMARQSSNSTNYRNKYNK